jgi:hypothetical protein
MLDIANIPEELREWFEKDVLPVVQKIDAKVNDYAPAVEHLASVVVDAVKLIDPAAGEEASAVVAAAEKALAEVQAIIQKYAGPAGM